MIASEARGAWQDIEQRLRPYVARRVASAADVDDVLQEIWLRMQRGLANLRDGQSFGGWAYRVAQSAVADAARARARNPLLLVDKAPDVASEDPHEAENLEAELGACVALFVARLPSPYREAVTLTEIEGLTQREAAEMLSVSLPALKSRVQRGREKLRDMFDECCEVSVDCRGRVTGCEPRAAGELPEDCRAARRETVIARASTTGTAPAGASSDAIARSRRR